MDAVSILVTSKRGTLHTDGRNNTWPALIGNYEKRRGHALQV